jgi:iron complex outermembrane receptor protein
MVFVLLLVGWTFATFAQITLKGKVKGIDGQPLPGANVQLNDTYLGQTTSSDGSFIFTNLKEDRYVVKVTYVGYEPSETAILLDKPVEIELVLTPAMVFTGEVLVSATMVRAKTPVAYTNVEEKELRNKAMGQDIPFLLMLTPSFIPTSDAGNGIGYTTFRVRGTDANRINVTMNGIPMNDAESHSTFFVDFPDLVSSVENVQIQRGAGTSTSGAAAFGASVNLQTLTLNRSPYARLAASAGSYHTLRKTISLGTGLLGNKITIDTRLSGIYSDGYIDRATSDLKSWYLSAGFHSANTILKVNLFSGLEETYQAWNGVPSVRLLNDQEGMKRYGEHGHFTAEETAHMISSGSRTFNLYTYKNQVDHYRQDHSHFYFSHRFTPELNLNLALHHTYGRGYYEQFKANQKFSSYGLPKPSVGGNEISRSDLIRRKWLDNDFYGTVFSLNYQRNRIDFLLGGGWNRYDGRHFGKLIWGEYLGSIEPDYEWYRNMGTKTDFNSYAKLNFELKPGINLFGDIQYRNIGYRISGIDDDLRYLDQQHRYHFLNPKAGLFFSIHPSHGLYLSIARAQREPNRDNFVDTPPGNPLPEHERLNDLEAGWNIKGTVFSTGICLYLMIYRDQLVHTGRINDVGAPVMTNVEKSHRAGIEWQWALRLARNVRWNANITLSRNRISDFTEYVDDWDSGTQKSFFLGTTDLAFSPSVTGNSLLEWTPGRYSINLGSIFSGRQFIDNTSSNDRELDAYFVSNLKAAYTISTKVMGEIKVHLLVNNLFNTKYESNAWVYSYYLGGKRYKSDGYFPQAGTHLMAGIEISL